MMSIKEARYQMGICLNCPTETRQRSLFATLECSGPVFESGGISGYAQVLILSLFECEGCRAILLYRTMPEDQLCGYSNDDIDCFDPESVTDLDYATFSDLSNLIYSTPLLYTSKHNPFLDPATPDSVKNCYEIATQVRPISKDLYALQLRKTLEAVCKDLGASDRLPTGRKAMLWQQIDELGKRNVVGEFISKVAHELKDISNTGAHYSDREVADADIRKLEHLLALITNYVYCSAE